MSRRSTVLVCAVAAGFYGCADSADEADLAIGALIDMSAAPTGCSNENPCSHGCCLAGACVDGTSSNACGGGGACSACDADGGDVCVAGTCQFMPCSTHSCGPGSCCDPGTGNCVAITPSSCAPYIGGATCVNCTAIGQGCRTTGTCGCDVTNAGPNGEGVITFNCPINRACDPSTNLCTSTCGSPGVTRCNSGCCQGPPGGVGTCVVGAADGACGGSTAPAPFANNPTLYCQDCTALPNNQSCVSDQSQNVASNSVCWETCSATKPCATGCCATGRCMPIGNDNCGPVGGACVKCSGSTPTCMAGACINACGASGNGSCSNSCCSNGTCVAGDTQTSCGSYLMCTDCSTKPGAPSCVTDQFYGYHCGCASDADCTGSGQICGVQGGYHFCCLANGVSSNGNVACCSGNAVNGTCQCLPMGYYTPFPRLCCSGATDTKSACL